MNALPLDAGLQRGLEALVRQRWPQVQAITPPTRLDVRGAGGLDGAGAAGATSAADAAAAHAASASFADHETWAFDAIGAGSVFPLVLRRVAGLPGSRSADARHPGLDLDIQATLLDLAMVHGIPVPKLRAVLRPANRLGSGFIMDRVSGESLDSWRCAEPRFAAARGRLARQCGQALARIHQLPIGALPTLRPAPATVELADCLARYRAHRVERPAFDLAFQWLARHAGGAPVKPAFVHGDFCARRLVVGEDGLLAVLGWQAAHLGDSMQDLGFLCAMAAGSDKGAVARRGVVCGGSREELFAGYEDAGGRVDEARVRYWEVFSTLDRAVSGEPPAEHRDAELLELIARFPPVMHPARRTSGSSSIDDHR